MKKILAFCIAFTLLVTTCSYTLLSVTAEDVLSVTTVGCGATGEGMHDFGSAYYFYINFTKELATDYADHISINGKTLTAWGDPSTWGNCIYSATNKSIEIYSFKGAGLGLAPGTDATMIFDSGLKSSDGVSISKALKFTYSATSNNSGNWVEDTSYVEVVEPLSITAVGCGATGESMHDFGSVYYFYINVTKDLASDYADHISINGKTLTAWGDPSAWGSSIYKPADKILEINSFKGSGLGLAPGTDATIIFDSGLKSSDGVSISKAMKFTYSATANNSGNWVKDESYGNPVIEPFTITAVGCDSTGESMHDFGSTYYFYIRFSSGIADNYADYIAINGKTLTEWGSQASWGSYSYNAQEKLLEIHSFKGAGLGLAPNKDSYVVFSPELKTNDDITLTGNKQFVYYASANNAGNWVADDSYTPPIIDPDPVLDAFDITQLGCWSTGESMHDFGGTWFFMIEFNDALFSPNVDNLGRQELFQNLIKINGKMVSQYNLLIADNVAIHYRANTNGEGGYLEFHIAKTAIPDMPSLNCTVVIMDNLKSATNVSLPTTRKYVYSSVQNNIGNWTRDTHVTDEDKNITTSNDDPFKIALIGVTDQNESIHDFNDQWYFRVYLTRALYNPNQNYPLVQDVWGKYFRINGKTIKEWNNDYFGGVQLFYVGSANNTGCFEVKINSVIGIINDITVENVTFDILPGLKAADGSTITVGQRFHYYYENNNKGNWIEDTNTKPEDFGTVEGGDDRYPNPDVSLEDYQYDYVTPEAIVLSSGMIFDENGQTTGNNSSNVETSEKELPLMIALAGLFLSTGMILVVKKKRETER